MDKEAGVERTPTKSTRFHPQGVNLATVDAEDEPALPSGSRRRKRGEDLTAFMSLRPGSGLGNTSRTKGRQVEQGDDLPEEEREYLLSQRKRRNVRRADREDRRKLVRRDWTCREMVWGSAKEYVQNRGVIDKVGQALCSLC